MHCPAGCSAQCDVLITPTGTHWALGLYRHLQGSPQLPGHLTPPSPPHDMKACHQTLQCSKQHGLFPSSAQSCMGHCDHDLALWLLMTAHCLLLLTFVCLDHVPALRLHLKTFCFLVSNSPAAVVVAALWHPTLSTMPWRD